MATAKEKLTDVLSLFVERFKLTEPYDSAGAAAIQAAIDADEPDIASLRATLAQYDLYPQYKGRINALLDDADSLTVGASSGEPSPKSISAMNKAELTALAEARGIDPTDATVAELREALHEDDAAE